MSNEWTVYKSYDAIRHMIRLRVDNGIFCAHKTYPAEKHDYYPKALEIAVKKLEKLTGQKRPGPIKQVTL